MDDSELQALVGLPVGVARQRVEARKLGFRITKQDGESLMITADYREDRVNVAVKAGVVEWAEIG